MKNNLVVLIPHYNDPDGLIKSLLSIDKDEKIDLLIIDDGSENIFDEDILRRVFKGKGEILFHYLEKNRGIEHALNIGLERIVNSNYEYIARLDSGDLCIGKRFNKQISFLKENSEIKLIGAHVKVVDTSGVFLHNIKVPLKDSEIRKRIYLSSSVLIHPVIMFRKEIIDKAGFYPTKYKASEDYAFYFNVLKHFKVGNIDEILLEKELNPNSISIKKRKIQALNRLKVIYHNFHFGYYPIIGFFRNGLLYIMPIKIITKIKQIIYLNK